MLRTVDLSLTDVSICCPETSVNDSQYSLLNIPEELKTPAVVFYVLKLSGLLRSAILLLLHGVALVCTLFCIRTYLYAVYVRVQNGRRQCHQRHAHKAQYLY